MFDLGKFGSNNDNGFLASSKMGEMFEDEQIHVSEDRKLNDSDNENLSYFFAWGWNFPIKEIANETKWLMANVIEKNCFELSIYRNPK